MQQGTCLQEEDLRSQLVGTSSIPLTYNSTDHNLIANDFTREHGEQLHSTFKMNEDCNLLLNNLHTGESLHDESFLLRKEGTIDTYESCSTDNLNYYSDGIPCVAMSSSESPSVLHKEPDNSASSDYGCQYCSKSFMLMNELSHHISEEHSEVLEKLADTSQYEDLCGSGSTNKYLIQPSSSLLLGENSEGTDSAATVNPLECKISNIKFMSETDQLVHMREEHASPNNLEVKNDIFACSFCPKAFKTEELRVKHETRHPYSTSAIECSKCGEVLGNYILLKEHKQYEDYLSSCDLCGKLFPNEECMVCHIRNSHNDFEDFLEHNEEEVPITSQDNCLELSSTLVESPAIEKFVLHNETNTISEQSHSQQDVACISEKYCDEELSNGVLQDDKLSQAQEKVIKINESSAQRDQTTIDDLSISMAKCQNEDCPVSVVNVCKTDIKHKADLVKIMDENASEDNQGFLQQSSCNEENVVSNSVCEEETSSPKRSSSALSKHQKMKCQFCTKKCSTQKSLLRHEKTHPYGTEAIKCSLCQEILENYKALKTHKKHQGSEVSCHTCNETFPNEICLSCHVTNVHNSVDEADHSESADDSNETDTGVNDNEYEFEDEGEGSEDDETVTPQYSVARFTISDAGAPLRITIKQEKDHVRPHVESPTYNSSTPPTPSTPSPQGPPTPSPPAFVLESESSNADDDDYEPYASDNSVQSRSGRRARRKTSQQTTQNLIFLSSSEESDADKSADFNYNPQSCSESEDDSDDDPDWRGAESFGENNKKRGTRRRGPLSDEDSGDDPDWRSAQSSSGTVKKKKRRYRKGPLSDNDSDADPDWSHVQSFSGGLKKRVVKKKGLLSDDDSDYDPDWRKDESSSGNIKKKVSGRKGRRKRMQVAFFLPALAIPKAKRSKARGCGGQKAQDAAAALAEAVEGMESSVPELKVVIRPLKRSHGGSITKASVKRYNEMFDNEYDYLLDVKSEPKEGAEESQSETSTMQEGQNMKESTNDCETESSKPIYLDSEIPPTHDSSSVGGKSWEDHEQEQIIIKAEPYDFHDDDVSQSSDPYSSGKFTNSDPKSGNSYSPSNKFDPDASDVKREMRYACKICGRELQYRSHLLRHLRRVHGGEGVDEVMRRLMKCQFCSKEYSNELSLINHEKLHDGTNKLKCNKCDDRFDDKNALRRHQRKTHWEHQPVECEICKKQLADNTCLKAHMKHMHGAEERKITVFTCETCGKQLHTKTAFQNHVASKCGTNLLFPCETCGKSFSFKGSLKAHQLLHTGVKSFLCKFCGKAFHQKGEMKRHERKHTGEKPFVCEVCGRAFAYRESLLGHSAVHTGIKPFPCKACGMRFSCSGNLVKHRRSNNCKGSGEQGENSMPNTGLETLPESSGVDQSIPNIQPMSEASDNVTKSFSLTTSTNNTTNEDQASIQIDTSQTQGACQSSVANDCQMQGSYMTSVIKTPVINVKPTSVLQSIPKDMKPVLNTDVPQSYSINNVTNRPSGHLNPVYEGHEHSANVHNNFNSQNSSIGYSENHFRQTNQVNLNERRFAQFSMDSYTGRTDQYFDRQSLMRREVGRQVMDRSIDRQTNRFLDCFGGVQFSGMDSRSSIQSYPASSVSHATAYPNIHSGHLGNYAAAHTTNHTNSHVNMYGNNTLIPGSVGFPAFTAGNHIGMGYAHNNPIPAHSAPHSGSFPTAHMSHFEALFGHLSHTSVHSSNSFPRLTPHNLGPSTNNSSLPSNHRV